MTTTAQARFQTRVGDAADADRNADPLRDEGDGPSADGVTFG